MSNNCVNQLLKVGCQDLYSSVYILLYYSDRVRFRRLPVNYRSNALRSVFLRFRVRDTGHLDIRDF